jgi:hypothetical protein
MGNRVVFSVEVREATRALAASAAELVALMDADPSGFPDDDSPDGACDPVEGGDPLRDLADACLDGLAGIARVESQAAALKVLVGGEYLDTSEA